MGNGQGPLRDGTLGPAKSCQLQVGHLPETVVEAEKGREMPQLDRRPKHPFSPR